VHIHYPSKSVTQCHAAVSIRVNDLEFSTYLQESQAKAELKFEKVGA